MPEGPEATHTAHEIQKNLAGHRLDSMQILKGRYANHGPPEHFAEFTAALPLTLRAVEKKGKVLFFHFDEGWYLVSHLGMTGLWYLNDHTPTWRSDFKSVVFHFGSHTLTYSDPRSYGTLAFVRDIQLELDHLAMDIVEKSTTWPRFQAAVEALRPAPRKWPIEKLLSDQHTLVSGIGNYLKSEILYAAHIAPTRPVNSLKSEEWQALFNAAKHITTEFLKALRRDTADQYEAAFKVYSRKTDPLGHAVHTYKNKEGRTVHWVPEVQK